MPLPGFVDYSEADAARYNRLRWWLGITLGDLLDRAADIYPEREALVDGSTRLTYSQLRDKTNRLAVALLDLGIKPKERVLLQLPNWGEFVYTYFALQKIGAIVVVLLARHGRVEIEHLCALCAPTWWILPHRVRNVDYLPLVDEVLKRSSSLQNVVLARGESKDHFPILDELIEGTSADPYSSRLLESMRPDPREVAHMAPTGGTTGLPKLVPRTHNDYICNIEYFARAWEMGIDEVSLIATPIGHNLALRNGVFSTVFTFGRQVMLDSTRPEDILQAIQSERVTALPCVPSLASAVVNYPELKDYDVTSLRKMYLSTQPTTAELIRDVNQKLGCRCVVAYGATEGFHFMTRPDYDQSTIHATLGRSTCPYDNFKVVDQAGNELPPGTIGELLVKGPGVVRGYFNAPEENKMAFTPEGFLKTGDWGMMSGQGQFVLTGRIKDLIKRGGESISPVEIERLMLTHPDVVDAAAIGMPDALLGERVCAYVQLKPGTSLTFEAMVAYLKDKGASVFLLPERVEFVSALPMTKAGKPDKISLREDIALKLSEERNTKRA